MNRIKTLLYYIVTIIICNITVTIIVYTSNKIFDNLPDVLFVPTKAAALGYLPFIIAASVALETTNNYEGTRKVLFRWKLIFSSIVTIYGLIQLIVGIYYEIPILDINDEVTFYSQPNHWLHNLPLGVLGIVAGVKIKKS